MKRHTKLDNRSSSFIVMTLYTGALLLTSVMFTGCDDFLSEVPDNRAQMDSKEKISELLVTAYPESNYIPFCEAMSDNVEDNPSAPQDVRNADPYFWRDASSTEQDTPEHYWNSCYAAIAAANHALRAIENADDPSLYTDQRGEALVARAYSHFMLVNLFAKMYTPGSANSPGIPYVTEPETESFKTYERHTVKYVYDMIEKDLLEGLPLINDHAYETNNGASSGVPKFHYTKAATHAFAVRYYLFKRDYEKVVEHANQVISSGDFASYLRPWNTTYGTYTASEIAAVYTNSSEKTNLLLCETASEWARSFNAFRYATGAEKYQEMFLQANPTGGRYAYSIFYTSKEVYFVNKFREHFVRIGTNATTGFPYTIVPLFTAEEVLLSRAEAYAMLTRFHEAMADLNIWVSKRIANFDPDQHTLTYNKLYNYYQQNVNREAILSAVLDFRRIEFLHEGLRWFDIRRHGLTVVHTTRNGETRELGPDDPRRVLQIPAEAVSMGGLAPNPR